MDFADWQRKVMERMKQIGESRIPTSILPFDCKVAWEMGMSVEEAAKTFLGFRWKNVKKLIAKEQENRKQQGN